MSLLPLDTHAHVAPSIPSAELDRLGAVVFAVTRNLDEATTALLRTDVTTVWGVGCHPCVARAHRDFTPERFAELLDRTPVAGELGFDGSSGVPLDRQRRTLRLALSVLAEQPRFVSLHSYDATHELLIELEQTPVVTPVLHWWLGTQEDTRRAVELGCYFSVNPAANRRVDLLSAIPLDRVLTETDHPFGERRRRDRAPGRTEAIERSRSNPLNLTRRDAATDLVQPPHDRSIHRYRTAVST